MSSKSYSSQTITSQDQRTAVEGQVGSLVSPGAAVGGGAAVVANPYSTVSQTISTTGLPATDVKGLMDSLLGSQESEREAITSFGKSLSSGLASQAATLTDALAATRVADSSQLTQALPFIVLGLILFLWRE
jgi:hypothetical protein